MVSGRGETVGRELDRVFQHGTVAGLPEGQLLSRFVAGRDDLAFEALVTQHGPMVLGVCRRMLGDPHEAADAFQATFLVLVRKAGSLRDADQLGPWLHGVAYKVAARPELLGPARLRERSAARSEASEDAPALDQADLRGILDEELDRLPEKYRRPIVLCYLEGKTQEEAARRLRCTAGMVRGRLDRARAKLRARLVRRGVAPATALAATALAAETVAAAVPGTLAATTVRVAGRAVAGGAARAAIPASVLSLVDGVVRSGAVLARVKLAATLLAVGAVLLVALPRAISRVEEPGPPAEGPVPAAAAKKEDGIAVTGRVLDREGRPIAGARVGQGSNRREGATPEAVTDARGRFAFRGVAPGRLILTVQAKGHGPDLKDVAVNPGMDPVEFRLGPGRSIGGQLIDLAGKPIAGYPVDAGPWRGHNSLVWLSVTDEEGRYHWPDAPEDEVMIDLGTLGYNSKRYLSFGPLKSDDVLQAPRPRFVRGSVTDAETGKPIERFHVLVGHSGDDSGKNLEWEYLHARDGKGGVYEIKLGAEYRSFVRYVRIEADGYSPARSPAFLDKDEAERDRVFDVALRRGDDTIRGVVRRPDGTPLPGADVAILTSMSPIANGHLADRQSVRRVKTGPDGRFRFPKLDSSYTVLVLDDQGVAERTSGQLAGASELTLTVEPWGRVEGTYRIGARPAAGQPMGLELQRDFHPLVQTYYSAADRTDASGHFAFDRVHPGKVVVSRPIRRGPFTTGYSLSDPIEVAPGATVRVQVGGTGRPVTGRLDLPAPLARRADWTWSEIWILSVGRSQRGRHGTLQPGGAFRFEDVPAGAYEVIVELKETPAKPERGLADRPIATARRRLEVPEMPGGRSDEPLDLGAIVLVPAPEEKP